MRTVINQLHKSMYSDFNWFLACVDVFYILTKMDLFHLKFMISAMTLILI